MSRSHLPRSIARVADSAEAVLELQTLRDFWRWSCARFDQEGIALGQQTTHARDEALALLLASLGLPPDEPEAWLDSRLCTSERNHLAGQIERRCRERIPTAYLTGEAWLAGLRFRADPRALIPRSLIAEAIANALPDWLQLSPRGPDWPRQTLDLCTGGGSLAIIAAYAFPGTLVSASDLSTDALALAADNVVDHGLEDRVSLSRGDLFEPLEGQRFDLILCNPPYVNDDSIARLPAEFRHEPIEALAGGADGMDLVRRIVGQAGRHLSDDGLLILEIGHEADHFERAFPLLEHHWLEVSAGERMVALIEASALGPRPRSRR